MLVTTLIPHCIGAYCNFNSSRRWVSKSIPSFCETNIERINFARQSSSNGERFSWTLMYLIFDLVRLTSNLHLSELYCTTLMSHIYGQKLSQFLFSFILNNNYVCENLIQTLRYESFYFPGQNSSNIYIQIL